MMKTKIKNLYLCLKDQLPIKRFVKNVLNKNLFGVFSKRSHIRADGKQKISYPSKEAAIKAGHSMMKKKPDVWFSNYKCMYCDGWHIGKNMKNMNDGSKR